MGTPCSLPTYVPACRSVLYGYSDIRYKSVEAQEIPVSFLIVDIKETETKACQNSSYRMIQDHGCCGKTFAHLGRGRRAADELVYNHTAIHMQVLGMFAILIQIHDPKMSGFNFNQNMAQNVLKSPSRLGNLLDDELRAEYLLTYSRNSGSRVSYIWYVVPVISVL